MIPLISGALEAEVDGVIQGGWSYVKWSYGLSWLVLGGYAVYSVMRTRKDV